MVPRVSCPSLGWENPHLGWGLTLFSLVFLGAALGGLVFPGENTKKLSREVVQGGETEAQREINLEGMQSRETEAQRDKSGGMQGRETEAQREINPGGMQGRETEAAGAVSLLFLPFLALQESPS